jgi:F-type H+-transporting ATPase subunit a
VSRSINLSPDAIVFLEWGFFRLNATIVYTWITMAILIMVSWLATRRLSTGRKISRWQNMLETVVGFMRKQIGDMTMQDPGRYLPFLGTLFLLISVSNLLSIVPGYASPMGSISTAAALAVCVFFAVPIFGIARRGLLGYLKRYIRPTVFMLPFHVIGEFSRTLALAVRLFGNVMSGAMIAGVLLSIAPLFVPAIMQVLDLLIGQIQAYIFAALATIYIASATRTQEGKDEGKNEGKNEKSGEEESPGGEGPENEEVPNHGQEKQKRQIQEGEE